MDSLTVNIGLLETLGLGAALVGTLVTITWYGASRLARVETKVDNFDKRLTTIEGTLLGSFTTHSPIQLTEEGRRMLEECGLDAFIDDSLEALASMLGDDDLATAYDIQEAAFDLFDDLTFDAGLDKRLKDYAFSNGISIQVLRRIGGIYFRDKLLAKQGATVEDTA